MVVLPSRWTLLHVPRQRHQVLTHPVLSAQRSSWWSQRRVVEADGSDGPSASCAASCVGADIPLVAYGVPRSGSPRKSRKASKSSVGRGPKLLAVGSTGSRSRPAEDGNTPPVRSGRNGFCAGIQGNWRSRLPPTGVVHGSAKRCSGRSGADGPDGDGSDVALRLDAAWPLVRSRAAPAWRLGGTSPYFSHISGMSGERGLKRDRNEMRGKAVRHERLDVLFGLCRLVVRSEGLEIERVRTDGWDRPGRSRVSAADRR